MTEPAVVNALSFDLEEWFQAEAFAGLLPLSRWDALRSLCERQTEFILELLEEKGVRATFFTLGWLAERHRDLVRQIAAAGHELGCHGYSHTMITKQLRGEFEEDVRRAKGVLEEISGSGVVGYRAPTFSVTAETLWALDALFDCGFLYDSSVYPIRHDRYGIPSAPRSPYVAVEREGRKLWEFPGFTARIAGLTIPAAGGGYLRLFPLWWAKAALRASNRRDRPASVYAHPWEFDPSIPLVKLPRISRIRHYAGIRGNASKLRRLLSEFRFAPMGEVVRRLDEQYNSITETRSARR